MLGVQQAFLSSSREALNISPKTVFRRHSLAQSDQHLYASQPTVGVELDFMNSSCEALHISPETGNSKRFVSATRATIICASPKTYIPVTVS